MEEKKLYGFLKACLDKLTDVQVENLKNLLFSVEEINSLEGKTRVHFLGQLLRIGRLEELAKLIRENHPNTHDESVTEHDSLNFDPLLVDKLQFENRKSELDKLLYSQAGLSHCWLVLGPTGYGKTEVLLELAKQYNRIGWLVCYVKLDADGADFDSVFGQVINKIDPEILLQGNLIADKSQEYSRGWEFAAKLKGMKMGAHDHGLVLLFDDLHHATPTTLDKMSKFVNGLFEAWVQLDIYGSRFIRVISAMRNQERVADNLGILGKDTIRLSPFDFWVVRKAVSDFITNPKIKFHISGTTLDQASAYLTHITAGHPKLLSLLLSKYHSTDLFSGTWPREDGKAHLDEVYRILEDIQKSIVITKVASLDDILEKLCVLRKFNEGILADLFSNDAIKEKVEDPIDLSNELLQAQLIEKHKYSFMGDGINRRLLFIKLRHRSPDLLKELCNFAISTYYSRLVDKKKHRAREILAIELLFQHLQKCFYLDGKRGEELRLFFFKEILPSVLRDLVNGEILGEDKREVLDSLIYELSHDSAITDWEFAFTLNYFTSKNQFDETAFNELLMAISSFRDQLIKEVSHD